mmetsp:Transcript_22252/g.36859  ORF Transcript_22252/g.36859 Transcript_22252/m.36859 type:complete len:95 (+) Transcript_22252:131-415(+)
MQRRPDARTLAKFVSVPCIAPRPAFTFNHTSKRCIHSAKADNEKVCPLCNGSGEQICEMCQGSGKTTPSMIGEPSRRCPACEGDGTHVCNCQYI